VSTSIETFRQEIQERGHQVALVVPAYGRGEAPEAGILRVPSWYVVLDPEDRLMRPRRVMRLAGELAAAGYDLLHVQTPFAAHYTGVALSRRLGVPRVETYHTFFEEYLYHYAPVLPKGLTRALARRFSRRQCNAMDTVVVPSSAMEERLRRYGVTVPMEVLPTGIRLDRFASCDGRRFRAQQGIDPGRPVLVYVGRVAHEKNIGFLVEVVARLRPRVPDILLLVAGEGPALEHLRQRVRRMGLEGHVRFVGYLSRQGELGDCYCAGDAFVFASRTETQGLVILEAMALGVPVVSTAVMGTRDVVREGQGALVAEDDPGHFAARVRELLGDPDLRARLGAAGRAYAAGWSSGAMAERMLALYGELAARRRTA
jgi:glycosyltransferase involved in cell wall biosynthesis